MMVIAMTHSAALDEEVAGVVGLGKRLESGDRGHHESLAGDEHEQRPGQQAEAGAEALDASARVRGRVALRQRVGGKMRAGARRRGDAHRHKQREEDLPEVVGLRE